MIKVFWNDLDFNFFDFRESLYKILSMNTDLNLDSEVFSFDFELFAEMISDSIICDRIVAPPCRVVDINLETLEIAVTSDHPDDKGNAIWMSFPYDFISRLSFEDTDIQKYSNYVIDLIKCAWDVGRILGNPESAYALAMCEMLKLEGSDVEKALKYCLFSADAGYTYAQESLLCICLEALEHDINVDSNVIEKAVQYAEEWYITQNPYAGYYLGFYYLHKLDYVSALKYFNELLECDVASAVMKKSIAKYLAPLYKDGLHDSNDNTIIYRNYYIAKKYYEMANNQGEYNADIEYINRQLGIHSNHNQMQLFAKEVLSIRPCPSGQEIYDYVIKDLASEFGDCWLRLPDSTRQDLISGCQVYIMLYALGKEVYKDIDFSSSIIPIVKACEIAFRRYISSNYYDYLINNGVDASVLSHKHPFVEYDKFSHKMVYKHKERIEFTMGAIKWVIGLKNGPNGLRTVNSYFLDYACDLFGADKSNRMIRIKIEDYFVRLANQMNQFTFNIRNPAAHSDIMPIWQAEICGNEIIKVRKVLKDFMDQIDPKHL